MGPMDNVNIGKGAVLRKLDTGWSNLTVGDCTRLLDELRDRSIDHVDVLVRHNIYTQGEADHVKEHWYGEDENGYWPNITKKQEILRAGYIRAVEEVIEHLKNKPDQPMPIVSYWICSGSHFQSLVCKSDQQITVILLTPSVSHYLGQYLPPNRIPEDMWLVGQEREIDQARAPALDNWFDRGDHCGPKESSDFDGIFWTQIYGN